MSTAKVVTVVHPSATVNNIVNDASGNVAVGGTLTVAGVAAVAVAPSTAGNVLTSNGTAWTSATPASPVPTPSAIGQIPFSTNGSTYAATQKITQGTVNAGGTNPFPAIGGPVAVDFTSIPSWVKRVTVMFNGVSTNGTSFYQIQIGTGGSPTTSGYSAQTTGLASTSGSSSSSTSGFPIYANAAAYAWSGAITLFNVSGNIWVASGLLGNPNTNALLSTSSGTVTLSGVLDIVRITTAGGTDTFDAGSINILYE